MIALQHIAATFIAVETKIPDVSPRQSLLLYADFFCQNPTK